MRAIPTRTDPLTRATMPAITSTAAMIHKMVSVLPPPSLRASRELRAVASLHPWQQYKGRRSVAHSVALRPFPTDGASGKPQVRRRLYPLAPTRRSRSYS